MYVSTFIYVTNRNLEAVSTYDRVPIAYAQHLHTYLSKESCVHALLFALINTRMHAQTHTCIHKHTFIATFIYLSADGAVKVVPD